MAAEGEAAESRRDGDEEEGTNRSFDETAAMVSALKKKVHEEEEAIQELQPDIKKLGDLLSLKKVERDKVVAVWAQLQQVDSVLDTESAHVVEEAERKLRMLDGGETSSHREVEASRRELSHLELGLQKEVARLRDQRRARAEELEALEEQVEALRAEARSAEAQFNHVQSELGSRWKQRQPSLGLALTRAEADRHLDAHVRASGLLSDIAAIHSP
uniref:Adventurous-gliding motility protein Z-like isoform X1 n=1 Tax=Petromyzon marinus TaxID=7757 RepID=A0AAJ7TNN2_PETMA|nr:adventurous-gliding motility protein Z-like isoform X1 [Petromyzon marinus]